MIDFEQLLQRVDGDHDFAKELIEEYLKSSIELIQALSDAIQKCDRQKIQFYSHSLKGSSLSVSASSLASMSEQLESSSKDISLEDAEQVVKSMQAQLAAVKVESDHILGESAA